MADPKSKKKKAAAKTKPKPKNFGPKTAKEAGDAKAGKKLSQTIRRREAASAAASSAEGLPWLEDATALNMRQAIADVLQEAKTPDSMFAALGKRHAEVLAIHASVSFDRIQSSRQKHITEATLQASHIRSQCVAVKLKAMRALDQGKSLLDSGRGYLRETYRDAIRGGTQEERKATVDSFFAVHMQVMNSMENVIDFADTIINDCDAVSWSVKRVADVMNEGGA